MCDIKEWKSKGMKLGEHLKTILKKNKQKWISFDKLWNKQKNNNIINADRNCNSRCTVYQNDTLHRKTQSTYENKV